MPGQHHITYTALDIERYLKNEMSPSERHQLEKAALDDPFLTDAIDGYSAVTVPIQPDLRELQERLNAKEDKKKVIAFPQQRNSGFPWLRAAAMIIILLVAGWAVYQFAWNDNKDEIARTTPAVEDTVNATGNSQQKDSSPVATPVSPEGNNDAMVTEEKKPKVSRKTSEKIPTSPAITEVEIQQFKERAITLQREQQTLDEKKDIETKKLNEVEERAKAARVQEKEIIKQETNPIANKSAEAPSSTQPYTRNADTDHHERMANARVFRGQVTDEHNNPLPFVNITSTRDQVGTYTDVRGNFTLVSTDSVLDVHVRSLGYENTRTFLSDEEETNRISLQEDRNIAARVLDTVKRNLSRARGGNRKFEEPEPADGWDYYDTYLVNNLNVPETFLQKRADQSVGEVELSFEVNRHGEPVNIKVEKSLCEQCDKEAIRLIKQGPKWKRKAKKSRTRVMVPFY